MRISHKYYLFQNVGTIGGVSIIPFLTVVAFVVYALIWQALLLYLQQKRQNNETTDKSFDPWRV